MSNGDRYDSDRTVIRPSPGGRRASPGDHHQSPPPPPPPETGRTAPLSGESSTGFNLGTSAALSGNPLIAAAADVLVLVNQVRELRAVPDIQRLREQIDATIRGFENRLRHTDSPAQTLDTAYYVVCVTVDDLVMNTSWGKQSAWSRQSIVSKKYKETIGGERFFEELRRLKDNPGLNSAVLELMYVCLSLGFQGHMRILPGGSSEIARLREDLYRLLTPRGNPAEHELSPHWRGLSEAIRPAGSMIPALIAALSALLIIAATYVGFRFALGGDTELLLNRLAAVPDQNRQFINRPIPPPPPPPREAVAQQERPLAKITKFLEAEIREGLVTVTESRGEVTVQLRNSGLFASASDRVESNFTQTLNRIGIALEGEKGKISVVGHTDNVPIKTIRFPSNWDLSRARAQAVRNLLLSQLSDPSRISAEGRADTEPAAPNATPEGRERNRRIDIVLMTENSL